MYPVSLNMQFRNSAPYLEIHKEDGEKNVRCNLERQEMNIMDQRTDKG